MFIPFFYELRRRGVPVGTSEAMRLAEALMKDLHACSLDGFYHVARALLVHSEKHLDLFDQAFLSHFKGVETAGKALEDELLSWLEKAKKQMRELTDEQRELVESLDLDELRKMFGERLKEQMDRHDGGNKWIGTGGTSPFGHSGKSPQGFRIGGMGGGRSAVKVADARLYKGYREDVTLDVRQMQLALRKLRSFIRTGAQEELNVEATIEETGKNAGELEIVTQAPRRSNTRIILMMDVGGSMDPYAHLCSRLFSATKKSSHFKELRTYYFHNCIYGHVYETERFDRPIRVRDLLHDTGRHYKLIMLGDALMAPYELLSPGGSLDLGDDRGIEGIRWLTMLQEHYDKSVWLNPEPEKFWRGNTIDYVRQVFDMFPLTLEGLGQGVTHLTRGRGRSAR